MNIKFLGICISILAKAHNSMFGTGKEGVLVSEFQPVFYYISNIIQNCYLFLIIIETIVKEYL